MGFLGSKAAIDSLSKKISEYNNSPEGIAEKKRLSMLFDDTRKCCKNYTNCYRQCIDNSSLDTCYSNMISKFKIMDQYPDIWPSLINISDEKVDYYIEEFQKWKDNKDLHT